MLNTGCWILSIWAALNLIMSTKIVVDTLTHTAHTPALYLLLTEDDVQSLSPDTIATLDSIAVFANVLNIAFCLLALCVIWRGLYRRQAWAFAGLLAGFFAAWFAGTAADFAVGNVAVWVNAISFAILAAGLALSAIGLLRWPAT